MGNGAIHSPTQISNNCNSVNSVNHVSGEKKKILGGDESVVETAFLSLEEAVESEHGLSPFDFMFNT